MTYIYSNVPITTFCILYEMFETNVHICLKDFMQLVASFLYYLENYNQIIIKYFQAPHRVYHMNVGDVHRFEEKLRATEKALDVKEGGF